MFKTFSTESFSSNHQNLIDSQNILQNISQLLNESYNQLPYNIFQQLLNNFIKVSIKRAQVENLHQLYYLYISKWVQNFKGDVQSNARLIILDIMCKINQNTLGIQQLFNKVKCMVIDTQFQYLIIKILLLQAKFFENQKQFSKTQKCLKKCIQYSQTYALQYLKQNQQVRKQLSDSIIILYYEIYKFKKYSNYKQAKQTLIKAYNASLKNYGNSNFITQNLLRVINKQNSKRVISNQTASTLICQYQVKKNKVVKASYLWQQQFILVQLFQNSGLSQMRLISEVKHLIKLDFESIQKLKGQGWIQVKYNTININQQQISLILNQFDSIKTPSIKNNRITIKHIQRDEIVKKQDVSSSDNSQDIIQPIIPQPNFLRMSAKKLKKKESN